MVLIILVFFFSLIIIIKSYIFVGFMSCIRKQIKEAKERISSLQQILRNHQNYILDIQQRGWNNEWNSLIIGHLENIIKAIKEEIKEIESTISILVL